MVKLRKAFSHKIHLHIRQGMLQRLWDKYVPAAAPEYEQIQLVYLGEQGHREKAPYERVNLLLNLVLKNRIMQMGLEQCPVKTAFVRKQMENSLQRMGRFYLTQLKCCNFVAYRKAEQFVSVLEQAQAGRIRYQKWQVENQSVEKQREHYYMISMFAANIREFLAEHSQQTMRVQEKKLLHFLSKKEYREFCRLCRLQSDMEYVDGQTVKWKKNKDKMFHFIDGLEKTQIRRLWAQMEYLATQDRKQWQEKLPEWEKEGFTDHRDAVLRRKLMQIRQQYRREVVEGFWQHVLSVVESGQFKAAADMTEISWKDLKRRLAEEESMELSEEERHFSKEERVYLSGEAVCEFIERIEEMIEQQKRRIEQREAQIIASYQEISRQASVSYRRESRMEEETARKLLVQFNQLQAEEKQGFVQELAERILLRQQIYITAAENARVTDPVNEERSFVLANAETEQMRKSFGYTEEEINGLISYIAYVIEKKDKKQAVVTEKKTEEIHANTTELAERQAQELFWQIASVMEKKTALNLEEHGKREIEEILSYIVDKSVRDKVSESMETAFTATEKILHSADGRQEQRMLLYIHNLKEESRREFIEKLAERILIWRQNHVKEEQNLHAIDTAQEQNLHVIDTVQEKFSLGTVDSKEENAIFFGYTQEQIEGLLSYVSYVIENKKKAGERISPTSHGEERSTEEIHATQRVERSTEEIHATELAEREAVELYLQLTSVIEKKQEMKLQPNFADRKDVVASSLAPYEKLWEWGKALLLHPEQRAVKAEADFPLTEEEGNAWGTEMLGHDLSSYDSRSKEEIQTEIIRRQIEAAKERNTLSQLIYQINSRISSAQEEKEEAQEPEGKLVYADSQLNLPEVKSLLRFVRELDERQYGRLVEELSEITKLQWRLRFEQGTEETETAQAENTVIEWKNPAGNLTEFTWAPGSQGKHHLAIAYPALVYRIEKFEKYRQREVRGKIHKLGHMYLQQAGELVGVEAILDEKLPSGEESKMPVQDSARRRGQEVENVWVKEGRILDLQYSVQESTVSEEEQRLDQKRMREENVQLKLAQDQIDRKLKEVEAQLQKVETTARPREDVRAFAEQVKNQLYEELHVEKLRRGLI